MSTSNYAYNLNTLTTDGTLIDASGYVVGNGVTVIDWGNTISVGRSEYAKDDLTINEDEREIVSKVGGWSVTWAHRGLFDDAIEFWDNRATAKA